MSIYCCPTIADDCQIIQLPKIHDPRGNLTFIEGQNHISFKIKRMYWIYDVPGGGKRGGHAYRRLHELIVAVSGSFDVVLDDGREKSNFTLNRSYYGLYVPNQESMVDYNWTVLTISFFTQACRKVTKI